MDKIIITNSEKYFDAHQSNNTILIGEESTRIIQRATFLEQNQISRINEVFTYLILQKGDDILSDLRNLNDSFGHFDFKYSGDDEQDQIGITHLFFRDKVEQKHFVVCLIELLQQEDFSGSVDLFLSERYGLFDFDKIGKEPVSASFYKDYKRRKSERIQSLKNKLYSLYDFKRSLFLKGSSKQKKRVVFVVQTAQHHHELLSTVYDLLRISEEVEPIVISYPIGLGDDFSFLKFIPEGVKHYSITNFRGKPSFHIDRRAFSILPEVIGCASKEANFTMFENLISDLNPDVCVSVGYMDTGRYLSLVCKEHAIPSISIDYSFIADDYTFEKYIKFDYRVTISEAQKEVWIKRNDPTVSHLVSGFLKYDNEEIVEDKESFFAKWDLDQEAPTIFFASSHGFDEKAKLSVFEKLSELCLDDGLNLIVKTHPLESDGLAEQVIKGDRQIVMHHQTISSLKCASYCDIVVSQGSSIVLDALYHLKPYVTFTYSTDLTMTDFMPIADEPFVFKAQEMGNMRKIIRDILTPEKRQVLEQQMTKVREKYLFKTDRNASKRVVELIESLIR